MSLLKGEIPATLNPAKILVGATESGKAVKTTSGISYMIIVTPGCGQSGITYLLTNFFRGSKTLT